MICLVPFALPGNPGHGPDVPSPHMFLAYWFPPCAGLQLVIAAACAVGTELACSCGLPTMEVMHERCLVAACITGEPTANEVSL